MSDQVPPQYPTGPVPVAPKGSGMAIASLILGILSLVLFCVSHVSIPCAVLAVILGVLARKNADAGLAEGRSMATAGMICGIVAIGVIVLAFAGCMAFLGIISEHAPAIQQQLQRIGPGIEKQQQLETLPSSEPSVMLDPILVYARAWLA